MQPFEYSIAQAHYKQRQWLLLIEALKTFPSQMMYQISFFMPIFLSPSFPQWCNCFHKHKTQLTYLMVCDIRTSSCFNVLFRLLNSLEKQTQGIFVAYIPQIMCDSSFHFDFVLTLCVGEKTDYS